MTTDYTQCCTQQKKKAADTPAGEPKKKKRKTSTDPDYDPFKDREETESPQPSTSGYKSVPVNQSKLIAIQKNQNSLSSGKIDSNNIETNANAHNTSFKVGGITFKPRTSNFNQPRPRVQIISPVNANVGK